MWSRIHFTTIFHHYSNSMVKSFCSHSSCCKVVATKFRPWHNGCAVESCEQFCNDMRLCNRFPLKPIFYRLYLYFPAYFAGGTGEATLNNMYYMIEIKNSFAKGASDFVAPCDTVYPEKYAHGFCFAVFCCGYALTDFPISIRLTSLALWQSNDCPSPNKATLMNMDKPFMWIHYER